MYWFFLAIAAFMPAVPGWAQTEGGFTARYLRSIPVESTEELRFASPHALSVDPEGNIFVLDTGNHRILKFDSTGVFLARAGGFGWDRDQLDRPLDITAKSLLDVFVADYNNDRIARYDRALNFISIFESTESTAANLGFTLPVGIDISRHGELFIADSEVNRVLKLDSFGEPVLSFGDFNSGDGQIGKAGKVEVGGDDAIYILDLAQHDIVVFDYYGNFLRRFGAKFLREPQGLFWTPRILYVADTGNCRIVMFDADSRFLFSWGKRGTKIGAFMTPADVAVFKGKAFVLDSTTNRVDVFQVVQNRI